MWAKIFNNLSKSFINRKILVNRTFSTMTCCRTNVKCYDIVVSGGGMVGATMAASLGKHDFLQDHKILLLEGGKENNYSNILGPYSSRVVAVSPSSVNLFQSIGAWTHIENSRYQEVRKMQVWDSCTDSLIGFSKNDMQENLAYIVENDVIMAALVKVLKDLTHNVEIRYQSKVKGYNLPSTGSTSNHTVVIELEDGEKIETKLLIGADGFKSLVRQSAGIQTIEWNYDQMAVVATLRLAEEIENNVAWQRFLKTGPIAMLPLSTEYSCLIWSTSATNAKNLLQLTPESFVDAVNHAFWSDDHKDEFANSLLQSFEGILTSVGLSSKSQHQLPPTVLGIEDKSRAMFPLGFCHATKYVKPRMALIGDAAHRVHPMAGQGVNLGFGDVASLRDQLVSAIMNGSDIGSLTHLLNYETERQRKVVPVLATVDSLKRLYSNSYTPLVILRSLGLATTNVLGPIKEQIIKQATT